MASEFRKILDTLLAEHDRQICELQEEIARLKKPLGKKQLSVSIATEDLSGGPTCEEDGFQSELLGTAVSATVVPTQIAPSESAYAPTPATTARGLSTRVLRASAAARKGIETPATTKSMHILRILGRPTEQLTKFRSTVRIKEVSWWRTFLESPEFDIAVSLVIVLNTVVMAVQIQYDGMTVGYSMNYPGCDTPGSQAWPGAKDFFVFVEWVFVGIYTLELAFKLAILHCGFFRNVWNWLDLLVVVAGLLDLISAAGLTIDPKTLRILRLCKLARGIKALKLGKFCDALQLLVSSISASCSTLFWALLVLMMFQCIAAMSMNQMLATYLEDPLEKDSDKQVVFLYFGNFSRSLVTMFEVVLANWAAPVRDITPRVGELYGVAILVYRCTCGFSVLNVVSAVFIQQTMKLMTSQTDIMLMEKRRAEKEFRKKLLTLLQLAGIPEHRNVSWSELETKLHTPDVTRLCFTLGIDQHDLEDIFHLLHRQGGMTREEFLEAALKIRREARTIDVARLLVHSRKMRLQLDDIHDSITVLSSHFEEMEAANANLSLGSRSKRAISAI